jgi:hypothetical protein
MRRATLTAIAGAVLLAWLDVAAVLAAQPSPSPVVGGDPRSPGEGPGFVGEPLLAIGGVLAIALLAILATTIWVRLTASRTGSNADRT